MALSRDVRSLGPGALLALVCVGGAFLWLFGELLFLPRQFLGRDTAYFFYPLFELVQAEWSAGRVPLWNPFEGCGTPLAGNPTAAVFYPGKLIFALPLSFGVAFKVFVLSHVLLAAFSSYVLARRFGAGAAGGGLCALAYAFGGSVLFQHTNVVFLCSAALLPFALASGERAVSTRSATSVLLLGSSLACMVLAGDPQTAYHAGILLALYAWFRRAPDGPGRIGALRRLGLAAALAAALAAIQIAPTLSLAGSSQRSATEVPRSIYEIPAHLGRSEAGQETATWYAGLIGKPPPPANHHAATYRYSVAPWRLLELLWPHAGGRALTEHERWFDAFAPGEGLWTPSLYAGILPLVLGLTALRLRRGDARQRFLSWILVGSLLAALGSYGPGWIARLVGGGDVVGDEFGGVYWGLVTFLPGYAQFRYPGKWLVVAALALAVLAGIAFDALAGERRTLRWLGALAASSGLLALIAFLSRARFLAFTDDIPARFDLGPFAGPGAHDQLVASLAHGAVACAFFFFVLRHLADRRVLCSCLLLGGTVLDLGLANRWMVPTGPSELFEGRSQVAETIASYEAGILDPREEDGGPFRVYRKPEWGPPSWSTRSSPLRLRETFVWNRDSLFHKESLRRGLESAGLPGTLARRDHEAFLGPMFVPERGFYLQPRRALDALGARYFVVPRDARPADPRRSILGLDRRWRHGPGEAPILPGGAPLERPGSPRDAALEDVAVLFNPDALPRAWIVSEIERVAPIETTDTEAFGALVRRLVYPNEDPLDLRKVAIVESSTLDASVDGWIGASRPLPVEETCRVVVNEPQRVVIEARMRSPGLVVLSDAYDPAWKLEVTTSPKSGGAPAAHEILRTNRVMRGCYLPEGDYELVFTYRPRAFFAGAWVSVISLIAALGAFVVTKSRGRVS